MNKIGFRVVYAGLMLSLITACTKRETDYPDEPLSSEWLLPIFRGELTPLALTTLYNREYTYSLTGGDLGFTYIYPSSSEIPLSFYDLGPFEIETNHLIHSVKLDTCLLEIKIANHFPIGLLPGTKFRLSNPSDDSDTLAVFSVDTGVAVGESKTILIDLSGKKIEGKLNLFVQQLNLGVFAGAVFNNTLDFALNFKKVSVEYVNVNSGYSLSIADTSNFDGSTIVFDKEGYELPDSSLYGHIHFRMENELPLNLGFQLYFLDENHSVIDSLFQSIPQIGGSGFPDGAVFDVVHAEFDTEIAQERIDRLKSARSVSFYSQMNSIGYTSEYVHVDRSQVLKMKAIGDLKLILRSSVFN